MDPERRPSVVIQGFGNVGGMAARLMAREGFKIICIIEYDGAVYNPNGLDIEALAAHRKETGSITGFPGGEDMDRKEAHVPALRRAAAGRHGECHHLRERRAGCAASILCEGANGPTTSVADEILAEKKIFVIPDILANAGGVTVSYFEWVQDRQGFFWNEQLVNYAPAGDHGGQLRRRGGVCGKARRQQSHRGLHAGARSRGLRHQVEGNLRLKLPRR